MMKKLIGIWMLLLCFFACKEGNQNSGENNELKFELQPLSVPSVQGGMPNLFATKNGDIYLSWNEFVNDTTDAIQFSKLQNGSWSPSKLIASGSDWFVNWADFPSIVAQGNAKNLAAHWLQKSANGTYDYDIKISQSADGGKTWQLPFIPHRDSIAAEHGFVSMIPLGNESFFATWLDGRNTKSGAATDNSEEHDHGHVGAMTLRGAVFDLSNNLSDEFELDDKVCDCCQTSVAMTDKGLIVAYRDRSDEEIRDISIVRQVEGKWVSPKNVYSDDWKIAGCPVNGPTVKALGHQVAIVWYSIKDGNAEIKVAFSKDSGANFGLPIRIDEGKPLGRVDLELLPSGQALVTWLEDGKENTTIRVCLLDADGIKSGSFEIAKTSPSRRSGFPVMTRHKNDVYVAWTHVTDSTSVIKTVIFKI